MSLELSSKENLNKTADCLTEGETATNKPTALLNKYLSGVLEQMKRQPRSEWSETAYHAASGVDQALFSMADINEKSKELKKEERKFSASSKTVYFVNAEEKKGRAGLTGAFALAAASGAALIAGDSHAASALCLAGLIYPGLRSYLNASIAPKTNEKREEVQEYKELKKAQMALKVLKKVYKETDRAFRNDPAGLFAIRNRPGARD